MTVLYLRLALLIIQNLKPKQLITWYNINIIHEMTTMLSFHNKCHL